MVNTCKSGNFCAYHKLLVSKAIIPVMATVAFPFFSQAQDTLTCVDAIERDGVVTYAVISEDEHHEGDTVSCDVWTYSEAATEFQERVKREDLYIAKESVYSGIRVATICETKRKRGGVHGE